MNNFKLSHFRDILDCQEMSAEEMAEQVELDRKEQEINLAIVSSSEWEYSLICVKGDLICERINDDFDLVTNQLYDDHPWGNQLAESIIGLQVWEGYCRCNHNGEYLETKCWRDLTPEEWAAIMERRNPFDEQTPEQIEKENEKMRRSWNVDRFEM